VISGATPTVSQASRAVVQGFENHVGELVFGLPGELLRDFDLPVTAVAVPRTRADAAPGALTAAPPG